MEQQCHERYLKVTKSMRLCLALNQINWNTKKQK